MFTVHVPPDATQSALPTAVGVMFAAGLTLYVPGPSVNLYFPVASVIAVLLIAFAARRVRAGHRHRHAGQRA